MGWTEFFEIVERQGGLGARRQALECDISASAFDRRVKAQSWDRPYAGVVRVPGAPYGPRERHRAALLAIGGDAALAGESALWWRGVTDKPPPVITILVDWRRRAPKLPGVRVIRSRVIREDDLEEVDGALVTTVRRAFLDLAGRLRRRRLRALLIDARQRRKVELADVAERALMVLRVPGRNRLLRLVAELAPDRADSILTELVFQGLVAADLVPDAVPATVPVSGRELHPDITFAARQVAIECDGYGSHSERSHLELDNRKNNAYLLAGWKVLRIDWGRFENDWDGFIAEVRAALAAAA
ncbi:MAG: endonuclease domain-containing protein [Actinobacteria bacterium]|nr:endonuclease domain-containing protein [Actinomycetota bacterium]